MEPSPEPEKKKRSKLRTAWKTYSWANRIRKAPDWFHWLQGFLQTKAGVAAAAATTAAAVTTTAVVVHNAQLVPPPPPTETAAIVEPAPQPAPEPPPPAEPVRQTTSSLIFAIEGKDKAGRQGTFDVVVAKKEFLWVRGSSDELEKAGVTITGADIAGQVLDDDIRAGLATAKEIIAVGAASQEGDATEETARAARRAQRTAEIIAPVIDPSIPILTLNLGQYRGSAKPGAESGGTNWQRPFMVIAVKELADGTELGEALADAMNGNDKLPSPASYSAFELTKFR